MVSLETPMPTARENECFSEVLLSYFPNHVYAKSPYNQGVWFCCLSIDYTECTLCLVQF